MKQYECVQCYGLSNCARLLNEKARDGWHAITIRVVERKYPPHIDMGTLSPDPRVEALLEREYP